MLRGLRSEILPAPSPLALLNALVPSAGYEVARGLPYGGHSRQRLDVYRPKTGPSRSPVVVFLYGGSWQSGQRGDYGFVGQALTSRGFVAVIPDYRVYPEVTFPAFVEDAASAVRWARAQSGEYGGDPDRIVLMGHSAGAHIAALLALDARYLAAVEHLPGILRGVIGLAGPYDFLPFRSETFKALFGPPEGWPETQPIRFANGGAPPFLLLAGRRDRTVYPRNSERLAARIREHGGQVETAYYDWIGHRGILAALAFPLRRMAPVLRDSANFVSSCAGQT